MKILKKAEQKNFIVNKDFYTRWDLEEMLNRGSIVTLFDDYRIYACDCKEVKVICHEGFYTTVAITRPRRTEKSSGFSLANRFTSVHFEEGS